MLLVYLTAVIQYLNGKKITIPSQKTGGSAMNWFSKKEKTVEEILKNFKLENYMTVSVIAKNILIKKGVYNNKLDDKTLEQMTREMCEKADELLRRKIYDAVKETRSLRKVDMTKIREETEAELLKAPFSLSAAA